MFTAKTSLIDGGTTGPIVPLLSFITYEEAITKANNMLYDLGASVWSSSLKRANKIAEKFEAGDVWVNMHFELDPRAVVAIVGPWARAHEPDRAGFPPRPPL